MKTLQHLTNGSILAVLIILTACQTTIEEAKVTKQLEPMERPPLWTVGSLFESIKLSDGSLIKSEYIARDGKMLTLRRLDGCESTYNLDLPFASGVKWKGCQNAEGTNAVTRLDDNAIYPLQVGNSWSYRHKGRNVSGKKWEIIRKCKVADQVAVTTKIGTFDTFKVICNDRWDTLTWYASPKFGRAVKFVRYRKNNNTTDIYETVRYDLK